MHKIPIRYRLESNVEIDSDGCWVWLMYVDKSGYGHVWFDGKQRLVHRVSYEQYVGDIPKGLQIDHLCRNRRCINPDHLEPVSGRDNTLRGLTVPASNLLKTSCPRGHLYNESNTGWTGSSRYCQECKRDKGLSRYRKHSTEINNRRRLARSMARTLGSDPGNESSNLSPATI